MENREIKFRAYQDNQMLVQPISGIYGTQRFLGFLYEETELMQFTGLKDKGGKDIYEGDIVQAIYEWESYHPDSEDYTSNSVTKKGQVYFSSGCWRIKNEIADLYSWDRKTLEIIGNIYENPELLK